MDLGRRSRLVLRHFAHAWDNRCVKTWKPWLKGLGIAVISAMAGFLSGIAIAPHQWPLVLQLAALDGIKAGAAYLKKSPLPGATEE